mgnify:CR=1 FL=1
MRKSNRIVVDTTEFVKDKLMELALIKRCSQKDIIVDFIEQEYDRVKKEQKEKIKN